MATTAVNSGGADGAPMDMIASILTDLGDLSFDDKPVAEVPAIDPETEAEIAAIPADEEEETPVPVAEEEDKPAEDAGKVEAKAEDEDAKPEIANLELSRWKRVHGGYKYAKALGEAYGAVDEDGKLDVTMLPAVEEVQDMRRAFSDRLAMEQDFTSGDPADAKSWVENWDKFAPEGMAQAAAVMPEYLAEKNPQAYQRLAVPVINRAIEYWYNSAAAEPNEQIRNVLLNGARTAEWWFTGGPNGGTYRDDAEITKLLQGHTAKPQTNAAEERAQRAEAEVSRIRQGEASQQWQNFVTVVNSQIAEAMKPEVDRVLGPVSKLYTPTVAKALENDFTQRYQEAMSKDAEGKRLYSIAVAQAKRSPTAESAEKVKSLYQSWARRAIRSVAPGFVKEAASNSPKTADSEERHAQLKKAASKTSPVANGGVAPPRTVMNIEARKPGENANEYRERMIRRDLGLQ